ncbi:NADPH-dependent oxidoreductase 2-alkenal reductase-like [Benincasa hispida]|uniref:NADPH-dependent oxidoreductase 2-alkenal reductase-like n=1 Tax=Benincasa hispida TaxID=102211 RepID=UPI0019007DE2|nr:NADPH-dependent oxidoreductase 2-alkenal reductase-like [Benincasa hispida]
MEVTNRIVVTRKEIDEFPVESDFEVRCEDVVVSVKSGCDDIIVKNIYVSIDPYQINRMKSFSSSHKTSSFAAPIIPTQPIDAFGMGEVLASGNPDFKEGDLVIGLIHWAEYSIVKAQTNLLRKLDTLEFPLTHHIGILGFSGLTAYAGLFEVAKIKEGETVFVSAASGSVGSLVGQLAKLHGCYVVGCAGSDQKVALLKEKLGFDDAFNYKQEKDLTSTLERYFPDGIDVYFDNVGAEMLEAAIANMKSFGRVALCGVISEYTNSKRAVPSMLDLVYKRIKVQGFLTGDFLNVYPDFISKVSHYIHSGKIEILEDISVGVESIPSAFIGLFKGDNIGKKMVKLVE